MTIEHLRQFDFWRRVAIECEMWTPWGYCWSIAAQEGFTYPTVHISPKITGLGRWVGLKGHRVAKCLQLGRTLEPWEEIDHLCYHPFCVKPTHLEIVDRDENCRRIRSTRQILRG